MAARYLMPPSKNSRAKKKGLQFVIDGEKAYRPSPKQQDWDTYGLIEIETACKRSAQVQTKQKNSEKEQWTQSSNPNQKSICIW